MVFKKKNYLVVLAAMLIVLASCGDQREPVGETKVLKGYIEKGLMPLMDTLITHYEQKDLNVDIDLTEANTYEVFRQLLSGRAPMIITSRTYTPREDSLLQVSKVDTFKRIALAHDALVLISSKDFPLDTLNDQQIKNYLSNPDYSLEQQFPSLEYNPSFAAPKPETGLYAAISRHIFNYEPVTIEGRMNILDNAEEVIKQVKSGTYDIGFALLSSVAQDTAELKLLRIGYNSEDIIGEDKVKKANEDLGQGQIKPRTVHASYIIMRQYPYIVTHWIYLQQDIKDNYFYFARYLGEDTFTQTYFTEQGIQGEHVKYKLRPQ
jgi:ABC-type phosphate transport system substrate-binding protein